MAIAPPHHGRVVVIPVTNVSATERDVDVIRKFVRHIEFKATMLCFAITHIIVIRVPEDDVIF